MSWRAGGGASPLTAGGAGRSSRARSSRDSASVARVPAVAGRPVRRGLPAVAGLPCLARRRPRQLQRGPLVLGHDRRGVDGGRRVVPGRGGHLLVGRRARGRVPVGQRPGRREVAVLVRVGGLGSGDQLHVGPQMVAADLDDVVGLLAERPRDGPVPVHRDVYQRDPHAEVLDVGDDLGQILFRADHEGVADRVVAGQRGQVAVNLGFHALAPAGADLRDAELDARHVGQRVLLGGAAAVHRSLVPVAAEQRQAGPFPGQAGQQLQKSLVVPGDRLAAARPVHGHGTIREHVTSVNEQRAAIHGPTVLPSAQRPDFRHRYGPDGSKTSEVTFPGMPFRAFPLPRGR